MRSQRSLVLSWLKQSFQIFSATPSASYFKKSAPTQFRDLKKMPAPSMPKKNACALGLRFLDNFSRLAGGGRSGRRRRKKNAKAQVTGEPLTLQPASTRGCQAGGQLVAQWNSWKVPVARGSTRASFWGKQSFLS